MFEETARRILRLVFGGGADISVANPLPVDASPSAVALTEILKTNDDALQSIQWEHTLGRSLNNFFNARIDNPAGVTERPDLDALWTNLGLRKPAGYGSLSVYSRRTYRYPVMTAYVRFPTAVAGLSAYIGLEAGGSTRTFIAALSEGTDFRFVVGGIRPWESAIVTSFIPVDYATVKHTYTIVMTEPMSELYIEGVLRAVCLHALKEAIPLWENNPPYALFYTKSPAVKEITTLCEIGAPVASETLLGIAQPLGLMAEDGIPLPPRQYALYNENTATKWNGQVIAAGSITSHPVPIWGYPVKTLFFQANGAGSLVIQIYTGGGWRTAKTVPIAANTLDMQAFDIETPIMRCVFTPAGFPTTVTAAEVFLS